MPIKKDGTGKRWVEMEFETAGTPEQVWQAMATGPGYAAWFTKAEIEEKVGGKLRFDFGPNVSTTGEVTAWQPPQRLEYVEREWSPGAPPVATEITITARSGSRCVVRMVHSLSAASDEWDDQIEGFEQGWPGFFEVLRLYLAHFAGEKAATPLSVMSSADGGQLEVWKRLTDKLGLHGAKVGEVRKTPEVPEALTGIIERVVQDEKQPFILLRLTSPTPGAALIDTFEADEQVYARMTLYFYGEASEAQATASQDKWQAWMTGSFSPST
jgi:uncharacterized protein YndB with AHSA1/START domain